MSDSDSSSPEETTSTPPAPAASRAETGTTIARNSLWLLIDSFMGIGVSFYCSIFAARRLGPDFMGRYNYILYFATVLRMVTEVAIPATVRKFAAEFTGREEFSQLKTVVDRALRLQVRLAGAGLVVGLSIVYAAFPAEQRVVATLAIVAIVPGLLMSIPAGALWATGNLRHNVLSSLGAQIVNFAGVTLSLLLDWGLVGLTASLLASRVVDAFLRYIIFKQQYARIPGVVLPGRLDPALKARMMRFAGHQLVLAILYALLFDRMEVFFLKRLAPTREIAFFSISLTLVQYLLMIPQNLGSSTSVSSWSQQGRAPDEAARTTAMATWFIMIFAAPELFGVAALSDPLLRLLYGSKYLAAIPVLTTLSLAGVALAISSPVQYLLVGSERQHVYIWCLCVSGALDIGANFLLIPHLGALGAAYAKAGSEVVACVIFLSYLVSHFHVSLPLWRMARVLLASLAMFAVVRAAVATLPALPALIVGIPVGTIVYVVLVRLLRCLDKSDGDRLRRLQRLVPGRAIGAYLRVVDFVAGV